MRIRFSYSPHLLKALSNVNLKHSDRAYVLLPKLKELSARLYSVTVSLNVMENIDFRFISMILIASPRKKILQNI